MKFLRPLLLALALYIPVIAPAVAQLPPINSVAGPTTSAAFGSIITNETGTGSVVFNTSPTLVTPTITGSFTATGLVTNAALANPATTVNGQVCTLGSTCTVTSAATTVTVGTTAVASGTTTRVLYDNAGVLGEYAISGTGSVAMTTSPTFVTPTLGAAAATSLTLSTASNTNGLFYNSGSSTVANLASAASGVLVTSAGSVPSISSTLPAVNASAATVTSTGSSVARSLAARGADVINVLDYATCGGTSETAALNAWLAVVVSTGKAGYIPGGANCGFDAALTTIDKSNVTIYGDGFGVSKLTYVGASTTPGNLLSFGNAATSRFNLTLDGFTVDSSTTLTSGNAIYIDHINDVRINLQFGAPYGFDLYQGLELDTVTVAFMGTSQFYTSFTAVTLTNAIEIHFESTFIRGPGGATAGSGIYCGGACLGIYFEFLLQLGNTYGILIDTALVASQNTQFFFGFASLDQNYTANVAVNDAIASGAAKQLNLQSLWSGTAGSLLGAGGTGTGFLVTNFNGGSLNSGAAVIKNNAGNGLQLNDASVRVRLSVATVIEYNTGWAVNASAPITIYSNVVPYLNTAGTFGANVTIGANGNASTLNGATFAAPGAIGGTTPSSGAFTTLSASGQITSTVSTGSAPFVVASTTNVANLNASSLSGATFAAPGAIGGGTPSTGAFTTLTSNGSQFLTNTAAAGTTRYISLQSGSSIRWTFGVSATAESGANAGSNFFLNAYDDAGSVIGSAMSVIRSTRAVTFAGAVTNTGATTLSAALTYGGVTLSNAVTGTGNMVLSAGPTFTGTIGAADLTATGTVRANTGINANGSAGLSATTTVRDSAGTGTCTLIFVYGIKTGGSC